LAASRLKKTFLTFACESLYDLGDESNMIYPEIENPSGGKRDGRMARG
jgi:hypothetical protein